VRARRLGDHVADNEAGDLRLAALLDDLLHAVVADVRISHRHNLESIGRIGGDLLISGQRRVEHDFADGVLSRSEGFALVDSAVFEDEAGRGHLCLHYSWLMPAVLLLLLAAISLPSKPDRYVTDHAGVIKNADALNTKLADFERQTSNQILVYVDQHLPPETTIEEMGSEAMRKWGVGQKGKDNGVILFVFTRDRKMRIEVGYGLEGSLTDAQAKRITSTVIKPDFQRGDFDAGINHGVDAILATIKGEPYKGRGRTVAQGSSSNGVTIPFWGCVLIFGGLAGIFALFIVLMRKAQKGVQQWASSQGYTSSSSSDDSSSSSSSDFSSSSSSSSDSFSGGGGDGGGGGASDSW